ncbi:hypothetical protein WICPIJ_001730 [Wickerhamomyces pijperi]|uniref:Uncharacterized protein n=1 Tax=Wickerhamomyces pijperi TaxID=599730 RepID=A0A9P8QB35_WICPI|nr:hypothetical protein WICPIJ_001730 [Wickerhamomyces pijperi]
MAQRQEHYIDIAEKTFDLSLEDASEDEEDGIQAPKTNTATTAKLSSHQALHKQFNVLDALSHDDSERPIAKCTTLISHSSNLTGQHTTGQEINKQNLKLAKSLVRQSEDSSTSGGSSKVSEIIQSNDIITRLHNVIAQLTIVSGNQVNPRYKQEQDPTKLLSFIERLTQSCQSKFDFLHDNYKYTNDLYETSLRENQSLKREVTELKELNRFLQRSTQSGAGLIGSSSNGQSTPPAIGTEAEQIVKLKKEIKEYKRFIKELMDRE